MMKICLCFRIHIPAIHSSYRFFNINSQHRYYDDTQLRNHTLKVYSGNLLPFFENVKNLSSTGGDKFKAAISISGITLALFRRFVPQAIELLIELRQKNQIEFLSETWSNSILAHVSNKLMIRQIMLHNTQMKSLFGVIPDVFIIHSPVSSPELFNTIFDCGKKAILTYSNHSHQIKSVQKNVFEMENPGERQIFLINYKASQALQEIGLNLNVKSIDNLPSAVAKKIKRNLSVSLPQAIIFNPGDFKKPFTFGDSLIWKLVISRLLSDHKIMFMLPSELKNEKTWNQNNNLIEETGKCCRLPDFWLKNNLQKDAFKRQSAINNMVPSAEIKSLVEEWDVMHDMEYLYFMDNHFFESKFTETHFNPFSGPYMAYTNYMNVLDDFADKITKQQKIFIKTVPSRKRKKNINEM